MLDLFGADFRRNNDARLLGNAILDVSRAWIAGRAAPVVPRVLVPRAPSFVRRSVGG
jgi:hypothetical protein